MVFKNKQHSKLTTLLHIYFHFALLLCEEKNKPKITITITSNFISIEICGIKTMKRLSFKPHLKNFWDKFHLLLGEYSVKWTFILVPCTSGDFKRLSFLGFSHVLMSIWLVCSSWFYLFFPFFENWNHSNSFPVLWHLLHAPGSFIKITKINSSVCVIVTWSFTPNLSFLLAAIWK